APTVRSRCQQVDLNRIDTTIAQSWLKQQLDPAELQGLSLALNLSAQAPLAALKLLKTQGLTQRHTLFEQLNQLLMGNLEPVTWAETWAKTDPERIVQWLLSWNMDVIRYGTSRQSRYIINQDVQAHIQQWALQLNLKAMFKLLEQHQHTLQAVVNRSPVHIQGLLEALAIAWINIGQHSRRL
ncbi:MAG: DNA polymerase III subunit delta' C-terminal domain-containing protein, partial [Pseudomonadota bacterium]|nr:DNA polymerase III subunit delta' C-terminal domain-containing protein [Pseudomonadota bacterium]